LRPTKFRIHELSREDAFIIKRYKKKRSSHIFIYGKSLSKFLVKIIILVKSLILYIKKIRVTQQDNNLKNTERTLHIFYRHVYVSPENINRFPPKKRPNWFSYEACFRNLVETINSDRMGTHVKLIVLFDGSPMDFENDFLFKYYANKDEYNFELSIEFLKSESALDSFMIMLSIIGNSKIPQDDLLYLLENDYLHQSKWVTNTFNVFRQNFHFDFVSLYDHPDLYTSKKFDRFYIRMLLSKDYHWRTAPSTCGSFLLTRKVFDRDIDVLKSCLPDNKMFEELIGRRKRVMLSPIPGLSTHCMEDLLSRSVEWHVLAKF
jgi:hypothetical protein